MPLGLFDVKLEPREIRTGYRNNQPVNLPSFMEYPLIKSFDLSPALENQIILQHHSWIPRLAQTPPRGNWRIWLYMAGRGVGKTRTGSEWTKEQARHFPLVNIIGPTADDARDVMVEGPTGILTVADPDFLPDYQPSKRRLEWPNGARTLIFTADEPERLRGKQHMRIWMDELGAWRYPEAYDQAMFGLRLGPDPRALITTTPKPGYLLRSLIKEIREGSPRVVYTHESTDANKDNLAPAFFESIIKKYEGTRLGRQELEGEYLDDTPGALWTRAMIKQGKKPEMNRVVVAIDPAVTSGENSDETGIVVAGVGVDGKGYVLADRTCRLSPDGWASRAITAYRDFAADRVIAEVNNGGDLVGHVIHTLQPGLSYKSVNASRGKRVRAEPVAALYEQGKVFHCGSFPELEDQLCSWTPDSGESPDRLDALVWALTELMVGPEPSRMLRTYSGA
jgi:phage terminase large subunit-like protein